MTRDAFIEDLLDEILRIEGWPKVTNHPWDKGALTKGGVTYVNYCRWKISRGETPPTVEAFLSLAESEARAFFADEFFRPFAFITDDRLFRALADWSVNAGPDDPARALQRALKARGVDVGAVDGVVGPRTRAAWQAVQDAPDTVDAIRQAVGGLRLDFHIDRAFDRDVVEFLKAHPSTQLRNLKGWIRRAWAVSS